MIVKQLWMSAALAMLGSAAQAQQVDCVNATSQTELTACAEQDWNAADAELNAAYKDAMAVLKQTDADLPASDRGGADFLRQAQRDWITFRDNACAAEAWPMHGGSAEPMVIYDCRARLTRERTDGLGIISDSGDGN
jgi:uncharacterized protein YecT (DUF1311 family)